MDDEGYVWVVDRKERHDHLRRPENIYCAEVENALADHPAIIEVAVIGRRTRSGARFRWRLPRSLRWRLRLEHLEEFLNERLARYKHPKGLEIVEALPRNPAGKVLKTELRFFCDSVRPEHGENESEKPSASSRIRIGEKDFTGAQK